MYQLKDGKKEKVYNETLDKAVLQKDGSYLSCSDKFTVLEPKSSTESNDIILKINDVDVGDKKYSETFTFKKGNIMSYQQKSSDKSIWVDLRIRPIEDDTGHTAKPDHIFY